MLRQIILTRAAATFRRWREARVTLALLDRLDDRSRVEFDALVRLRRDAAEISEFDRKGRSVRRAAACHIARDASCAHS